MLKPGDVFDRYSIEALLGEGSMGRVYRAFDKRLHRRVALKLLHPSHASEPRAWDEAKARLLREARAAAALHHPYAVSIFDLGEVDGVPFIAMEYAAGRTLRAWVGAEVPWAQKLRWLVDVATALGAAHAAGLVHRDVKPENVLVGERGEVKVLDFGIARRASGAAGGAQAAAGSTGPDGQPALATLTGQGVLVGSPLYMAPEQLLGLPLDGRADQFAWAVVAYELFAGVSPWPAELEWRRVISAILMLAPASLGDRVPELPAEVVGAVHRALNKEPWNRFATMDELVAALEPFATPVAPGGGDESLQSSGERGAARRASAPPSGLASSSRSLPPPPRSAPSLPSVAPAASPRSLPPPPPSPRRPHYTPTSRPPAAAGDGADGFGALPPPEPRKSPAVTLPEVGAELHGGAGDEAAGRRAGGGGRSLAALLGATTFSAAVGLVALYARHEAGPARGPSTASLSSSARPAEGATGEGRAAPGPSSSNAEALAAYREGVRALRAGSRGAAAERLGRAAALDPRFAAAHLRRALAELDAERPSLAAAREAFAQATEGRAHLNERDRALLEAFDPVVRRPQADWVEARRRLRAAVERFGGDAELATRLGAAEASAGDFDAAAAAYERALGADPGHAEALGRRGELGLRRGDFAAAERDFGRCLELAAGSELCLRGAVALQSARGRCEEAEQAARRWQVALPNDPGAYGALADVLWGLGRPPDVVEETLRQKWQRLAEPARRRDEPADRVALAVARGDFGAAERAARDLEAATAGEPDRASHAAPAWWLVSIYEEVGRSADAAKVADTFLRRQNAWTSDADGAERAVAYDVTPKMLESLYRAGKLNKAEFDGARARWVADHKSGPAAPRPSSVWVYGYAAVAKTPDEAREALALASTYAPIDPVRPYREGPYALGPVYFLAGQTERALPELNVDACQPLGADPFAAMRHYYWRGVALEAQGARHGACAAYRQVLARWGHAHPASLTANRARGRFRELGCSKLRRLGRPTSFAAPARGAQQAPLPRRATGAPAAARNRRPCRGAPRPAVRRRRAREPRPARDVRRADDVRGRSSHFGPAPV
jgi:serine/threonine-protein kinase